MSEVGVSTVAGFTEDVCEAIANNLWNDSVVIQINNNNNNNNNYHYYYYYDINNNYIMSIKCYYQ